MIHTAFCQGFTCTGVDISTAAIEIANKTAVDKKVKCQFIATDVLGEIAEVQDTVDFIYNWKLLHHIFTCGLPCQFIQEHLEHFLVHSPGRHKETKRPLDG